MLQALSKNTFLTFVGSDAADAIPCSRRSRSVGSTLSRERIREIADPQHEQIHHALQKLNKVLSNNAPHKEHLRSNEASSPHERNRNVGARELSMPDGLATEDADIDVKVQVEDVPIGCVNQHGVQRDHPASTEQSTTSRAFQDGSSRSIRKDAGHSLVPRSQNFVEIYNSTAKDAPPTTMMIRNLPGRYTHRDLMNDLEALGLAGTYDFLYMPVDNWTHASVGYAFVNFTNPSWATACQQKFQNFVFKPSCDRNRIKSSCYKKACVSVAHLQGLEKNLQHYEKSVVNSSKRSQRRPVVMASISKALA